MAAVEVWKSFEEDGFLKQFLTKIESKESVNDLFDNVMSVSEMTKKLAEGIVLVERALHHQVCERTDDLVSQLEWIDSLGQVLVDLTSRVQSLVNWVERLRQKVWEPYGQLKTQTLILSRLHTTCDLLRRALRVQQLARKLPDQDAPKAALTISELSELSKDVDLTGLEILESDLKLIKKERARTEKQALAIVCQGLHALNPTQVGVGIEILRRLGIAEREVNKLMEERLQQIEESVTYALDVSNLAPPQSKGGPGRVAGTTIPGNITSFRAKLWAGWEHVLTTAVFPACAQMVVVQNVLNNRNNSLNFQPLSGDQSEIASTFWSSVDNYLTKQLELAARNSSYMKQALEGEYPRLLRLHLDLHKQLSTLDQDPHRPVFPSMGKCVKVFETAYLSRSLKLVLDSVREIFPEGESPHLPPSTDKVDSLVKTISSELSVSLVDETLSRPVASNIAKAVSLFCQKGEQMVVVGPHATQVIDKISEGQEVNGNIANTVEYLCEQVRNMVANLSLGGSSSEVVLSSLEGGSRLIQQILSPLLDSVSRAINDILLTIHQEDFNMKESSSGSSLYMRELKEFCNRVASVYMAPLHSQHLVASMCLKVTSRCFELFVRNVTLVRPVSDAGRKRLVADFKAVEEAVGAMCPRLSELGGVYAVLRSVRPLMVATPEEVAQCPVLGHVVPYSLALTLLFPHGPPELPSPHQSVGWSMREYSEWLDKHTSERERLEFLTGTVHKYESTILKSGQTHFHPVYPVMKQLLQAASASLSHH